MKRGAGKMTDQLRALAEDLGWFLEFTWWLTSIYNSRSRGSNTLFWFDLHGYQVHTYTQAHILKRKGGRNRPTGVSVSL